MVAFPYYDPAAINALDQQAQAILALFEARGYRREEPPVLQPAEIFLDRSGEEIRRRTFTLTDPSGRDLCLRPDLTIPICKHAVDSGAKFPARICYNGLAFRHQPARPQRPTQFFQAGVELLGLDDLSAGETEIMSLAFDALRAAGLTDFTMLFGDLALFGALVEDLKLPAHWGARLKRNFWRAGYVDTLLRRLGDNRSAPLSRAEIEARIGEQSEAPLAGRSRDEIVARALEQAAEAASLRLDPVVVGVITKLFAISGPAREAVTEIRSLLKAAGIRLEAQMDAMEARLDTIAALGLDLARVRFTAHFGRNMEYYTGFVFELAARDAEGPLQVAGGGRYDTLMQSLGAGRAVSAIGCAIRTERLLAARRFPGEPLMALTLAIPSKGRLKEACNAWFADAGLVLEQTAGARGYRATFTGLPGIEVMLLSAGEIAASLLAGDVQLGITGEDLLREAAPELEGRMHLVCPMGFGFADVVVAVSRAWIDAETMADLDDVCAAYAAAHGRRLRVATKYAQLTRSFFAHAGIADYRIVPSAGATEGAPAAGTAEVIVDITTTGATLRDNGLKILDDGVILKSQAQLAASLTANWPEESRAACAALLARLEARAAKGALYPALDAQLPK